MTKDVIYDWQGAETKRVKILNGMEKKRKKNGKKRLVGTNEHMYCVICSNTVAVC